MSGTVFIPLPGNDAMAAKLTELAQGETGHIMWHKFPDGETHLDFPDGIKGRNVALVASLSHPDGKLLPLIFAARTAREFGARKVGLIAPYLCYMRQDKRFHAGEAVTSRVFASLISESLDWLVTLDPHLHRYKALSEIYSIPTRVAHSAVAIGQWIKEHVEQPFLVGPDEESAQWVAEVAGYSGVRYAVLSKKRLGDRQVRIPASGLDGLGGATPVLVDDIISSGATMLEALRAVKPLSKRAPVVVAVHGIFAGRADQLIEKEGARLVTTNSVAHASNQIDIAGPLAKAICKLETAITSQSSTEA
jgi:ribose-phosphate pyrophosphokinase